ncbi:MAG: hypothetical protein GX273_08625 [Bacteroidales bacterium]|nr:hypothetical protein [Bacteroidales bacterium]
MRALGIPTLEDRIVQQTLVDILQPKFEKDISHRCSCGYRPNLGATRAVQLILWNVETGYNHIYDCDIRGFFDNIPPGRHLFEAWSGELVLPRIGGGCF